MFNPNEDIEIAYDGGADLPDRKTRLTVRVVGYAGAPMEAAVRFRGPESGAVQTRNGRVVVALKPGRYTLTTFPKSGSGMTRTIQARGGSLEILMRGLESAAMTVVPKIDGLLRTIGNPYLRATSNPGQKAEVMISKPTFGGGVTAPSVAAPVPTKRAVTTVRTKSAAKEYEAPPKPTFAGGVVAPVVKVTETARFAISPKPVFAGGVVSPAATVAETARFAIPESSGAMFQHNVLAKLQNIATAVGANYDWGGGWDPWGNDMLDFDVQLENPTILDALQPKRGTTFPWATASESEKTNYAALLYSAYTPQAREQQDRMAAAALLAQGLVAPSGVSPFIAKAAGLGVPITGGIGATAAAEGAGRAPSGPMNAPLPGTPYMEPASGGEPAPGWGAPRLSTVGGVFAGDVAGRIQEVFGDRLNRIDSMMDRSQVQRLATSEHRGRMQQSNYRRFVRGRLNQLARANRQPLNLLEYGELSGIDDPFFGGDEELGGLFDSLGDLLGSLPIVGDLLGGGNKAGGGGGGLGGLLGSLLPLAGGAVGGPVGAMIGNALGGALGGGSGLSPSVTADGADLIQTITNQVGGVINRPINEILAALAQQQNQTMATYEHRDIERDEARHRATASKLQEILGKVAALQTRMGANGVVVSGPAVNLLGGQGLLNAASMAGEPKP